MKKEFLRKKLNPSRHPEMREEIEQSIDIGKSVSISPRYTFYYSRETGCQIIQNKQIIRMYIEWKVKRYSTPSIIFELKGSHTIKIPGSVDLLRARLAYDKFCPEVLIGPKGKELSGDELQLQYFARKQSLRFFLPFMIGWIVVFGICTRISSWLSLLILTVVTVIEIVAAVLAIWRMTKYKE